MRTCELAIPIGVCGAWKTFVEAARGILRAGGRPPNAGQQPDAVAKANLSIVLNEVLPSGRKFGPMDQSSNTQNRRSRRSPVFLAATVEVCGRAAAREAAQPV
jgi:hypothetical protein